MWKWVRVFELDKDRNSILCSTQSFSIRPYFEIYILFNQWERKRKLHMHENKGLYIVQYFPPQKGWGRLQHDQKLVRKQHRVPVTAERMTEIIAYDSSWQSHYSSGLGGNRTKVFSEHREIFLSFQKKWTDWPFTVINTWSSSGVIRRGACVGTQDTFSHDYLESMTPGAYNSEGSLFSSIFLCRLDMELKAV